MNYKLETNPVRSKSFRVFRLIFASVICCLLPIPQVKTIIAKQFIQESVDEAWVGVQLIP